jgi:putative addiction module component (TIGR02574 family)
MVMGKTLIEVEKEVDELTFSDKEILVQKLMDEIDPMEDELKALLLSEVRRRREEILSGKVKGIPLNEAMKEMKRRIDERGNSSSGSIA